MNSFKRLCGLSGKPEKKDSEQAVIIHFSYGKTDLSLLFELEGEIEEAIKNAEAGEFDGHEVAADGKEGFLYTYGPSADRLYDAIEPILKASKLMKGARVTRRYGPPDDGVPESLNTIE